MVRKCSSRLEITYHTSAINWLIIGSHTYDNYIHNTQHKTHNRCVGIEDIKAQPVDFDIAN